MCSKNGPANVYLVNSNAHFCCWLQIWPRRWSISTSYQPIIWRRHSWLLHGLQEVPDWPIRSPRSAKKWSNLTYWHLRIYAPVLIRTWQQANWLSTTPLLCHDLEEMGKVRKLDTCKLNDAAWTPERHYSPRSAVLINWPKCLLQTKMFFVLKCDTQKNLDRQRCNCTTTGKVRLEVKEAYV